MKKELLLFLFLDLIILAVIYLVIKSSYPALDSWLSVDIFDGFGLKIIRYGLAATIASSLIIPVLYLLRSFFPYKTKEPAAPTE